MSFLERLYNFNLHVAHILYMYFQFFYANYYIQEKFPNEPPIDEIVQKLEFIMVNSNEFVDYPRLLPPNVIQVGGLQIKEPKDLPQVQYNYYKYIVLAKIGGVQTSKLLKGSVCCGGFLMLIFYADTNLRCFRNSHHSTLNILFDEHHW